MDNNVVYYTHNGYPTTSNRTYYYENHMPTFVRTTAPTITDLVAIAPFLLQVTGTPTETIYYNTPINPPLQTVYETPTRRLPQVTYMPCTTNAVNNTFQFDKEFSTKQKTNHAVSNGNIRKARKPGYAFIFNNEKFDIPSNSFRTGSEQDTIRLQETFEEYGMIVEVFTNYTIEKIKSAIDLISNIDYSRRACLIIALLSHGTRNDIICARNGTYSINDDVLFPILRNRTLDEKPKIFFVQACKGSRQSDDLYTDSPELISTANEVLKFYSTFEGYVAYRKESGSVFIRTLCKYLKKYGDEDILDIIKVVIAVVKDKTRGRQIPSITSSLTKTFKFGDYL